MSAKKMNGYRLQYWLYAVLNHQFGKDVKMKRDPLHHMYSVNRHGFTVHSHNSSANQVYAGMTQRLLAAGFVPNPHENQWPDKSRLIKKNQVGDLIELVCVTVEVIQHAYPTSRDRPFVSVWSGVYHSEAQ
jgi:hypothetical protein